MSDGASIPADAALHESAHARARACADFLHLPFRNRIWKGQTGDFLGAGVGSSLDFQDHRQYVPGDDPRHINWQAYARTGSYTMKLYREEVRPLVDVIFDASNSMFAWESKARRALELLYFCVESALRGNASLQILFAAGNAHERARPDAVLSRAWPEHIAEKLAPADQSAPTALATLPLRGHSMRIFISDLLYPGSPGAATAPLAARSGRGIIFAPFTRSESNPDWEGNYEFIDAESRTRHLNRVELPLLKKYRLAYQRHFELWKSYAVKHGAVLARVPAEEDFQQALHSEAIPLGAIELL